MKIFEGFIFLAIATAIYITSTSAVPVDNGQKRLFDEDSESEYTLLDLPLVRYFASGIPKYIQDIKEIIGSTNPMDTAFSKIREILPKDNQAMNSEVVKIIDDTEIFPTLVELGKPKLVGIAVDYEEIPATTVTPKNSETAATEKPVKLELDLDDVSVPYSEILDWALKKLGYADTEAEDTKPQIIDLNNDNNPHFRINYERDANSIDEVKEEPALTNANPLPPIFNIDEHLEYENEPQWL